MGDLEVKRKLPEKYKELKGLVDAANKEDPPSDVVSRVRELLDESPELWTYAGDLSTMTRDWLILKMGGSKLIQLSVKKGFDVLRQDLGYEHASQLERLLIEHLQTCWLRLLHTEYQYSTQVCEGSTSIALADYWERRLNAAQRRFLRASETLARVRKLIRRTPALQVNIATEGGQQVNVIGEVRSEKQESRDSK